jgi:putative ABC transport system permease protein
MRLLRELSRRKLRTTLTILGITIGIWALVVFSSMANKINALVEGGSQYYANKILVTDGSAFGTAPMSLESANSIRELDGVAAVDAQIQLLFDEEAGMSFGIPDLIIGAVPGADEGLEEFQLELASGRMLRPEDDGRVVVLGSTMVEPGELVNQVVVYPEAGADVDEVATRIEGAVANSATLTGAEFDEQVGASTAIFNAIIIGVAVISLVVGGLSVINTMAMSVAERTREIGIKRAIGGSRGRIIRALVAEAGLIGLIGGLIGLGLGALVVVLANEAGRAGGTVLFDLTPETAIFAVGFSTILGMVAGIIPAWSAARLDPVTALRYE